MTVGNSFPGPTGVTDTTEARKAFAGLVETDASGNVRTGLFPSNATAVVAARSDMNLDVAAFTAVASQFPAGATAIFFANDGSAQLGSALVSPGAGTTNYYIVYAKQNESTAPGTDANTNTVLSAALSTTNLATARAALPQGAVELAEVTMPTGKTATNNSGVIITQTFKYTAAEGGLVWLRNQAEEDAWTPADGATAWRMDLATVRVRRGGAWTSGGPAQYRSAVALGAFSNAFVSKAAVTLPKGTYDLSGIVEVNHSTATAHIYDAQIYNSTDATIIASGQMYFIAGTLRLTLNFGDTVTLAATKTIQLRVKFDGAEGTQLISAGQLRATEIGVLL